MRKETLTQLLQLNEITLKRRNSLYLNTYFSGCIESDQDINAMSEEGCTTDNLIVTFMENIASLGYTLSESAIYKFRGMDMHVLRGVLPEMIKKIQVLVGADVVYKPMYPGFPEQVRDADSTTLYMNALIHYISGGKYLPEFTEEEIGEKVFFPLEYDELKKLNLITDYDEVEKIFMNLIGAKTSISADDVNDLRFYFRELYHAGTELPEIPMKENLAIVTNLLISEATDYNNSDISCWYKTSTDVLRLYVCMSDGDVSLSTPTRFINLSRKDRKLFMDLLNNVKNLDEDFALYKEYWKRAGERIHPNSFSEKKYYKVREAFFKLYAGVKIKKWRGCVHELIANGEINEAVKVLSTRPGEFARNLDLMLRKADEPREVLDTFLKCMKDVSTPVLLQMMKHFETRSKREDYRIFFPKGNISKAYVTNNTLPEMDAEISNSVVRFIRNEVTQRLSQKGYMGKVYVDENVKKFVVPFSQRSASTMSKPCVRGSRIPIKEGTRFIRPFVWWTNMQGDSDMSRVDIDLSASFIFQNETDTAFISYMTLANRKLNCFHSGDITNGGEFGGEGASEFIDIDLKAIREAGCKYVIVQAYVFNGGDTNGFSKGFPSRAGFMELGDHTEYSGKEFMKTINLNAWHTREGGLSKKGFVVFDASKVEMKMDITSSSSTCVPLIIDCESNDIIWTDMNGSGTNVTRAFYNTETMATTTSTILDAMIHCNKLTIGELIDMNIQARGIEVKEKADADIIFDIDDGITPFDVDRFMTEFM